MVYKRFYLVIVIRVGLLAMTALALAYFWWLPGFLHLKFLLAALFILQVVLLVRFLNKVNRKLSTFFDSIRSDDSSFVFTHADQSGEFASLNRQLDKLSAYFQKLKLENEQKNLYFKAVIDHVATGILSFDQHGRVNFINQSALKMLDVAHLKTIHALDSKQVGLAGKLSSLQVGARQLLEVRSGNESMQLSARSVLYKAGDEQLTLVSLQNIRPELEQKETQTWQKLIRILTHEIMNSVSPITSLAASLSNFVKTEKGLPAPDKATAKLAKGLSTIKGRGEGLLDFVTRYRELTILPQPNFTAIHLMDLFERLRLLTEQDFRDNGILLSIQCDPPDLVVRGDPKMIEQVLINLINNAIWAVGRVTEKMIVLQASKTEGTEVYIRVIDNGPGIEPENLDKIFIPFFTTREEGSGIGLSLSRQIMLLHGGAISAETQTGGGCEFILRLPD